MTVGITSFQGRRLRQARALRRMSTITALADLSGISKQMISRYEADEAKPTEARLLKLVQVLNLPIEYFLKPIGELESEPALYRSMSAALRGDRERAAEVLEITNEIRHHLEEYVELPSLILPRMNVFGEVRGLSADLIEDAASKTREQLGFPSGPLPNLVALAENNGVLVVRTELADRELDGVSRWYGGRPVVILNTTKSAARSRFDLAHELGHIVLHSFVPPEVRSSPSVHKELETQAHRFGSALLLPSDEFREDLWVFNLEEFVALKPKWQTSAQAMLQRTYNLNLISSDDYVRMRKQISARKWRTSEPLESVVREEYPTVIRQSLEVIRDTVPGGADTIRRCLPFGNILAEVAGVTPTYFDIVRHEKIVDIRKYQRT